MDCIYNMTSVIFHCLAHEDGIIIEVANQTWNSNIQNFDYRHSHTEAKS